jgi:hypothetical protein
MQTQTRVTIHPAKQAVVKFAHAAGQTLGASRFTRSLAASAIAVLAAITLFSASANATCSSSRATRPVLVLPQAQLFRALQPMQSESTNKTKDVGNASIVGLWHVKFVASNGDLYDEGFDQFHSDGTEILNDDGVPPAEGNVCLGVFKKIGQGTYRLKHPAFVWDGNGGLVGTLIISETITLDPGRNRYNGTFEFDFYDLAGSLTDEVKGDLSGERIAVN